jgi:hypothetical protein
MRKLKPSRQGTTEYVRLADLPERQVGTLLNWLPESCFTKVNAEERTFNDCIDYEDYEFWFEHCAQQHEDLYEEEL